MLPLRPRVVVSPFSVDAINPVTTGTVPLGNSEKCSNTCSREGFSRMRASPNRASVFSKWRASIHWEGMPFLLRSSESKREAINSP